jgi:hypothetical protein
VALLKTDVAGLKRDVAAIKTNVEDIRETQRSQGTRLNAMEGRLAIIERQTVLVKA